MTPLARDVMTAYTARTAGRRTPAGPRCRCSTPTTALWQRELSARRERPGIADRRRQLRLLADTLSGLPDVLQLPGRPAAPGPAVATAGARRRLRRCRADAAPGAAAIAREHNATTVHGRARGARVLLSRLSRHRRHRGRHARRRPRRGGARRPGRHVRQHPGAADARSTRRRVVRRAARPRCGRPTSVRSSTRTCRSSGWSTCSPRSDPRRTPRCSRCCSSSGTRRRTHLELPGLTVDVARRRLGRREVRPAAQPRRTDRRGRRARRTRRRTAATPPTVRRATVGPFAERFLRVLECGRRRPASSRSGDIEILDAAERDRAD